MSDSRDPNRDPNRDPGRDPSRETLRDTVRDLKDELAASRADNARLRRLLDEAGVHEGLRHGLRDTVAMLRALMRRTAEDAEDVESYVAHLEGRLDVITRARARTDAFGEADLHTLVSDALFAHLVHEGERASLSGPTVRLRPKAAQALALAVHELASNAVEHGPLGDARGGVRVAWTVEPDPAGPVLALSWRETGGAITAAPRRRGFGTVVLEELLAYDLGARTVVAHEPDGLRCSVRLPLTVRVGCVVADEDDGTSEPPPIR